MFFCLLFAAHDDMAQDIKELLAGVRKNMKENPFFDRSPSPPPSSPDINAAVSKVEQNTREAAQEKAKDKEPFHEDVAELLQGSANNIRLCFPNLPNGGLPAPEANSTAHSTPPEVRVLERVQQQVRELLSEMQKPNNQ